MVNDILRSAATQLTDSPEPLLDARVLLAHAAGVRDSALLFRDLTESEKKTFDGYIALRKKGVPVAYILKEKEFMGFSFYVDENTLIPRPDTECLVERVLERAAHAPRILDLCTGSGCIGISLALMIPGSEVLLTDISGGALKAAAVNIKRHRLESRVSEKKLNVLTEDFPAGFNIIVSNPPYIPTDTAKSLEVSKSEPFSALDGGADGLKFYREIIKKSAAALAEDGLLALEIGFDQGESAKALALEYFRCAEVFRDYADNDRVVICSFKDSAIKIGENV